MPKRSKDAHEQPVVQPELTSDEVVRDWAYTIVDEFVKFANFRA